MKPLAIDLFCGLGGWADGFLAEGYDVVGFDNERHCYGEERYPAQLVLQDVLKLSGSQFTRAAVIVASPPCQTYSYMAMPWTRAKVLAAWYREEATRQLELNCLFNSCFRIASEAGVPIVVENVAGAQPWVGSARWHFGSFYLWGDVPALMPSVSRGPMKLEVAHRSDGSTNFHGRKGPGGDWFLDGRQGQDACSGAIADGRKVAMNFHEHEKTGKPGRSFQSAESYRLTEQRPFSGTKHAASGAAWYDSGPASRGGSHRKAASAQIAKIPFPLAQHIARCFRP